MLTQLKDQQSSKGESCIFVFAKIIFLEVPFVISANVVIDGTCSVIHDWKAMHCNALQKTMKVFKQNYIVK